MGVDPWVRKLSHHVHLENNPKDETRRVIGFCRAVGLPVTLRQLGVEDRSPGHLMQAAEASFGKGSFMDNLSFEATPELVLSCIIVADALGKVSFHPLTPAPHSHHL